MTASDMLGPVMRMPTPPDTMQVIGFFAPENGRLTSVVFAAYFASPEEVAAFASRFPKGVRARQIRLGGVPGIHSLVEISLSFSANKATGAKNDASLARYAAVLRAVKKLDIRLVDGPQIARNQLPDLAAIDRAVSALHKTPATQLDREIAEALRQK